MQTDTTDGVPVEMTAEWARRALVSLKNRKELGESIDESFIKVFDEISRGAAPIGSLCAKCDRGLEQRADGSVGPCLGCWGTGWYI